MSGDDETLDFYSREAVAYADYLVEQETNPVLTQFMDLLPGGGSVLDFGAGSGWAARAFRDHGFSITAIDGSAGLADEARRRYNVDVSIVRFDAFADVDRYDGVWASFCLLHDSREAMPGHLARLATSLREGGYLYVGLKEGQGAERDSLGRLYTFFSEEEMRGLLAGAGFDIVSVQTEAGDGYDGVPVTSMHIFARRD